MLGLLKMCYTCLGTDSKDLIDVSDMDFDRITFLYKLKACVSSQLEENSSKQICITCIKQLRMSYRFREMVLLSQETLGKHKDEIMSGTYVIESKLNNQLLESEYVFIKEEIPPIKTRSMRRRTRKITLDENADNVESPVHDNGHNSDDSDYLLSELRTADQNLDNLNGNGVDNTNENGKIEDKRVGCESYDGCDIINTKAEMTDSSKDAKKFKTRRGRPKKRIKDSKVELEYECFHCGMVFNKRWKLQKHITRVHSVSKKYVCTYCNKGFKQSYHLREHLTSHTGERNYTCSFCDKSFQRISSMRRHIRSHEAAPGQKTKRTPFLCTVCGKSFPFSNGVQRHMRIHLGIKNHECSICNRRFTQSTHLHVHMRTHTGEKPYICDTCGDAFSLNASLQKHMTVHQNTNNRSNLLMLKS